MEMKMKKNENNKKFLLNKRVGSIVLSLATRYFKQERELNNNWVGLIVMRDIPEISTIESIVN